MVAFGSVFTGRSILLSKRRLLLAFEEEVKYEQSLVRIKRVCRVSYRTLRVVFVLVTILFASILTLGAIEAFFPDSIPFLRSVEPPALIPLALFSAIGIAIFWMVMLLPKDALVEESPFTLKQARRIRNIALLLLAKELAGTLFPMQVIPLVVNDQLSFSFEVAKSQTFIVYLNVETFLLAALLWCISLIFQYGVLLQKETKGLF